MTFCIPAEHPRQPHHTAAILHRSISIGMIKETFLDRTPAVRPNRLIQHPIGVDAFASSVDLQAWLRQAKLIPDADLNALGDVIPLRPECRDGADLGLACAAVANVEIQAEAIVDIALGLGGSSRNLWPGPRGGLMARRKVSAGSFSRQSRRSITWAHSIGGGD